MFAGNKLVQDFVVFDKYAHYLPHENRRETWKESTDRYIQFMKEKFPSFALELELARPYIENRFVLPSMRLMQTAGPAAKKNPARGYNCWYRAITSWGRVGECLWVLLSGCGVGYSVQQRHIRELDPIRGTNGTYRHLVPDTIEGWADLFKLLFEAYTTEGPKPAPDYQDIRRKGSRIKGCNGLAPGYKPLSEAFTAVDKILADACRGGAVQASDLLVHEILCLMSEAVLSGGVRRSAMICFFDADSEPMLTCKTGNWWETKKHLQRANNSAVMHRYSTREEFDKLWNFIKSSGTGDPAIYWVEDYDVLSNPCQREDAPVLTPSGIRRLGDVGRGDIIWSGDCWTKVVDKWSTGVKPVYKYTTRAGYFEGTEDHRVLECGQKVRVGSASGIDVATGPRPCGPVGDVEARDILDGLVFGDGTASEGGKPVRLCVGAKDFDYFTSEVSHLIGACYSGHEYRVDTTITREELPKTYLRCIPDRFKYGCPAKVCAFLRGLYSANGSICGGRVTLKASSLSVIEDVQIMLSSVGISSYYTVNRAHDVEFSNGLYTCRESYDLNITADKEAFAEHIGFIQSYKSDVLGSLRSRGRRKNTYEIVSKEYLGDFEVFDITVDCPQHTYWSGGLRVSNCGEVSLFDGQFCNLTTINAERMRVDINCEWFASMLGTLQAALTDFYYLSPDVKRVCEEQRIIGVSISGTLGRQLADPSIVVGANGAIAGRLGIEPAWRTTTIKPEGTASKVFGSNSAGCHPWYGKTMWQRMRLTKGSPVHLYLKSAVPDLVDDDYSEYEAVISVPMKAPEGAVTRSQVSLQDHLGHILDLNNKWVAPGHRKGPHHHNVSATVSVREDEWDALGDWVWENRFSYHGISTFPYWGGGHKYSPWEECSEEEWAGAEEYVRSADVDFSKVVELRDSTNRTGEISCAGGECEEL